MASKNFDKIVEEIGSLTVLELADLVKGLEDKFGVSAAMPVAAAPAAAAAATEQQEEKSQWKVTLQEGGPEKVKIIKALRQVLPTMNLTDAKKAVEGAPTVLAESAPTEEAKKMKTVIEEAGAKVTLS